MRVDMKTGQWENFGSFVDPETKRPIGSYGINADRNNNLYMLDFNSNNIGVLEGATKKTGASIRRASRIPARAEAASTNRTVCGSPNMTATR